LLITIIAVIAVLGVVVFFHELGHFIAAKLSGVRVHRFSLGFPPKMVGFKWGETEYCISWIPLGGYVKMAGENPMEGEELGDDPGNLLNKPAWKKAIIFFAGPFANFLTAILIATALFFFHGKEVIDESKFELGVIQEGLAADQAGLMPGDVLHSMDGIQVINLQDIHEIVYPNPGKEVNVVYNRAGRMDSALVTIGVDTAVNIKSGDDELRGWLGISQKSEKVKVSLGEAFILGNKASWNMVVLTVNFLKKFVTGEVSRKLIGGPIAIAKISGQKAREGIVNLIDFIAILSINLAVLNLLPIPILDGGHLVLLGVEVVRRKSLTLKQKAIAQQIGLAFLLILIIFVFYNDLFVNLGR